MSWAIRVTFGNRRDAFLRHGGVIGHGPIATFHSKAKAEEGAAFVRKGLDAGDVVTVIERSHGRRAGKPPMAGKPRKRPRGEPR